MHLLINTAKHLVLNACPWYDAIMSNENAAAFHRQGVTRQPLLKFCSRAFYPFKEHSNAQRLIIALRGKGLYLTLRQELRVHGTRKFNSQLDAWTKPLHPTF